MSSDDDLTLRIMAEIRKEVRTGREELELRIDHVEKKLDTRIDGVERRLDDRVDGLERRMTESEIRITTEIKALSGTLQDIKDLFRDRLDLRDRVGRCEQGIDELRQRIG
jgi:hypothetical protein